MEGKKCRVCDCSLGQGNFSWYRAKNYIWVCDDCNRKQKAEEARRLRARNPKLNKLRNMAHKDSLRKNNPVKYTTMQMLASSKKRAKSLGMDHDLDRLFLESIAPKKCPVFGFDLKYGGGSRSNESSALDRIDSTKGYTKDNVQIISFLANLMKSSASVDQQVMFANWVMKNHGKDIGK